MNELFLKVLDPFSSIHLLQLSLYIVLLPSFILHRKLYLAWPRNSWSFKAGPDHMDSSLVADGPHNLTTQISLVEVDHANYELSTNPARNTTQLWSLRNGEPFPARS